MHRQPAFLCYIFVKCGPCRLPLPEATDKLQEMVRPFTLRDLALVRRLSEQGVCLHTESALADDLHQLLDALTNLVGGKSPTLIYKSEERERAGFIQLLLEEGEQHAHILYLSPALPSATPVDDLAVSENDDVWLPLLDEAVFAVGKLGIQSLVAEVDESGPELPILRRAGFAVYARQDIWHFDQPYAPDGHAGKSGRLMPYLSSDEWDVQLLYANTVPRLVQLVEPVPPLLRGNGWILRDEQNELMAFVHVHDGSAATWLRFFIHPSAESEASQIVRSALTNEVRRRQKPVYCCVRRYEGWLPAALLDIGFAGWGSQAVMVKHTVHHSRRVRPQKAVAIESSGMPVTSPYVGHYSIEDEKKELK